MSFLVFLEGLRSPFLNHVFMFITQFGSEAAFFGVALYIFWCRNKREGYYLLSVGFFGEILGQFLKIVCRLPRPWVVDKKFEPVSAALADAGGYSFPSGHTQNAVGTYIGISRYEKIPILRIICIVLAVLVPLSRMYLGVHTPLDVGVGAAISLLFVFGFYPMFAKDARKGSCYPLLSVMIVCSAAFVAYTMLHRFPADVDAVNLAEAQKNAWSFFGGMAAMLLAYWFDDELLGFETDAVWWAQAMKLSIGAALTLAIKEGLKEPLLVLLHGYPAAHAIRYALVVIFLGCIWPISFSWFSHLGKKKK